MSRRGWVLFAVMSVVWGIPYLLIKVAVDEVSVPVLVFARTAVGAAVLLPAALYGGRSRGILRHRRPLAAFATIEIIVPGWLLSDAT
ncbi:EamA family transporter [Planomonospora sp. ID82291]|uniref:EamA family transporter n=1 Tax=Planomonospora sp. ID82291 TaxID=2738136 RepID=UPI0018C3E668|nr:EamA family transporter [Planomonospora sp. ID82291]MBG0814882.1 EamA family transporter [Planomonospora sp. ID82291]